MNIFVTLILPSMKEEYIKRDNTTVFLVKYKTLTSARSMIGEYRTGAGAGGSFFLFNEACCVSNGNVVFIPKAPEKKCCTSVSK